MNASRIRLGRATRDRYLAKQRAYRARQAALERLMREHGWRYSRSWGVFVPAVTP